MKPGYPVKPDVKHPPHTVARAACRLGALLLLLLFAVCPANGALLEIAQLTPYPEPNVTPGITGIAFDTDPNPLILDRWAWTLARINRLSGATLSSQVSNPVSGYNTQLLFDPATGYYYTTTENTKLVRIDRAAGTHATVGNIGAFFNYLALGIDPAGDLWLAGDRNNEGELWKVNKTTGVGTLQHTIDVGNPFRQITSFVIDSSGKFYVSARAPAPGQFENIYQVDPATGIGTFATSTGQNPFRALIAMTQDPLTHYFYAISEHRDVNPYTYYYAQITDLPEPAVTATGFALLAISAGRIRRRRVVSLDRSAC
jgi:hypothetical protein